MYSPSESVSISISVSWSPVSITITSAIPSPSTVTIPPTLAVRMIVASKSHIAVSSVATEPIRLLVAKAYSSSVSPSSIR